MTSTTQVRNSEVENSMAGAGAGPGFKPQRMAALRTRAALGDVGNRKTLLDQGKQPLKPTGARAGLSRQKATTKLVPTTRPSRKAAAEANAAIYGLRRSSGSKKQQDEDIEPMETEIVEDVEMDEAEDEIQLPVEMVQPNDTNAIVEDIDTDDKGNPQSVCNYVNEIYAYMRELESRQNVPEDYLASVAIKDKKAAIKPRMRNMLINWLVEVHDQFNLLQETLYLTVATIDRYLAVSASTVDTKMLQLVGVTAMFIASKYEEMYPPEIGDFVYITDKAYTASQIRKMEIKMIAALGFEFGRPLPLNFLRRASKAGQVDAMTHSLAKYALELSLLDYKMAHLAPSLVAAASLAYAMRMLDQTDSPLRHLWTPTLVHYTSYSLEDIRPVVALAAEAVAKATEAIDTKKAASKSKILDSVANKYKNKKFLKVSLVPEIRSELARKMALGGGDF